MNSFYENQTNLIESQLYIFIMIIEWVQTLHFLYELARFPQPQNKY
jgi:hypothetical protein